MAYDSAREVVVLFGGAEPRANGETWEWTGSQWNMKSAQGPEARTDHLLAYDEARGLTVLWGGIASDGRRLQDMWTWDGGEWTELHMSGPPARIGSAMAYDANRAVVVLFGGKTEQSQRLGDTWEWNGSQWTQVASGGPSARYLHAMTYDAARQTVMLFGGTDGGRRGDTWEWNGSVWRMLSNTGPSPRAAHALTYDVDRSRAVLFGGESTGSPPALLGDTWETTGATLDIVDHPADQIVRRGQPASFTVVAEGRGKLFYLWRRDGQPLVDGGTISGSRTETLSISRVFPSDAALYDVRVTGDCGIVTSMAARLSVVDPTLWVSTSCPDGGQLSITWEDATPNGAAALVFAARAGTFRIPTGFECAGTRLGLGTERLQIVWRGDSEADGSRTLHGSAGPGACGGYIQLVDLPLCATSNVVQME